VSDIPIANPFRLQKTLKGVEKNSKSSLAMYESVISDKERGGA